ncbi:hypothetical protein [Marinimicrobium sp. ABcell2]|uniref:hypothetical protein n=1 Tax=Marinimicrobium sp. ABcell2 TaxID=3069751 RepID=UPI0027AE6528|nr:hypothetical protein [Marinimicrobium sp. ABcell2]MDQ2077050.1 hypothetical protein [Marinimicrobium sp. ABcell2]
MTNQLILRYARTALGTLLVLFLFVGCATHPALDVHVVEPLGSDATLESNHGVLVVRVIDASSSRLPFNYVTLAPRDLNRSSSIKPFRLSSVSGSTGGSTLFAVSLPAGHYSVASLLARYSDGDIHYARRVTSTVDLGTFEVVSEGVTDLGEIVYFPRIQEDRYTDTLIRIPNSSTLSAVKQLVDADVLSASRIRTWDTDGRDTERFTQYSSAAQNPVAFNGHYRDHDDNVYFFGKLGVILIRTPDGNWGMKAIDSASDMHTMAVSPEGHMAIGGDMGEVHYRPNNGAWRTIEFDPRYSIRHLYFHNDHTIDVVARTHREILVFRQTLLENGEPKRLAYYNSGSGWIDSQGTAIGLGISNRANRYNNLTERIGYLRVADMDGTTYLMMSTQRDGNQSVYSRHYGNVFTVDRSTWALSDGRQHGTRINYAMNAGQVNLGANRPGALSMRTSNRYFRLESDTGRWVELASAFDNCADLDLRPGARECVKDGARIRRYRSFEFVSTPVFSSPNDGLAFVRLSGTSTDNRPVLTAVTSDGGGSWQEAEMDVSPPRKHCFSTVPEASDTLLVNCMGADFFESNDNGKSWRHVRQRQQF